MIKPVWENHESINVVLKMKLPKFEFLLKTEYCDDDKKKNIFMKIMEILFGDIECIVGNCYDDLIEICLGSLFAVVTKHKLIEETGKSVGHEYIHSVFNGVGIIPMTIDQEHWAIARLGF